MEDVTVEVLPHLGLSPRTQFKLTQLWQQWRGARTSLDRRLLHCTELLTQLQPPDPAALRRLFSAISAAAARPARRPRAPAHVAHPTMLTRPSRWQVPNQCLAAPQSARVILSETPVWGAAGHAGSWCALVTLQALCMRVAPPVHCRIRI